MLARLAHLTLRHRWAVIGAWVVLTLFGAFAAGQVSDALVPEPRDPRQAGLRGEPADAAAFGAGARAPNVVVFHTDGDATKSTAIERAMQRAAAAMPGALTSSYFSTGSLDVRLARPAHDLRRGLSAGPGDSTCTSGAEEMRAAAAAACRPGSPSTSPAATRSTRRASDGSGGGSSVLVEAVIGGARRARDPAVRLRDAAGGADADRRRDRPRSSTRSRSCGR